MRNQGKIAVAVAGGYLLGRSRNAKLAIGLGLWLTGKKITIDPARLPELAQRLPILGELNEQVRADLTRIGKEVGGKALTAQGDRLADALNRRTESLREADGHTTPAAEPDAEPDAGESEGGEAANGGKRGTASARARRSRSADPADAATGRPARGAARKSASTARRAASGAARTPARKRATAGRGDGDRDNRSGSGSGSGSGREGGDRNG